MKQEELLRYVGNMQQLAYARRVEYDEGRARGLHAVEVKNGPLTFSVMLDKCMDIGELSYRGEQMTFLSKPGLNGRNPFDTHGSEAQRSIMGGLFFTCGFENICAPYRDERGREYPMHGRMRTSPAEHVSVETFWENGGYVIAVSGDIREAELFGENMLLHRRIETRFPEPEILVKDTIRNEAFREEPMMVMYHCNLGYPFLREGTKLLLPTGKVTARDQVSQEHIAGYAVMDPPKDNETEYVYLHELLADEEGNTFAAAVNDDTMLGLEIGFNRGQLPYFGQWKSIASGDYVMGLEPGNAAVYGRGYHERQGTLPMLPPQSQQEITLRFRVVEGREAVEELKTQRDNLLKQEQ